MQKNVKKQAHKFGRCDSYLRNLKTLPTHSLTDPLTDPLTGVTAMATMATMDRDKVTKKERLCLPATGMMPGRKTRTPTKTRTRKGPKKTKVKIQGGGEDNC